MSLFMSQDLLHYNMTCIIYVSCSIYIYMANLAANGAWVEFEKHLEMPIQRTYRCTMRPWRCENRDILGGCDRVRLEMHLEDETEWMERCTGESWSRECRCSLWGRDQVNSGMQLEAIIDRLGDEHSGCHQASLEKHLEAIIEQVWRFTGWPWSCELAGHDGASLEILYVSMIKWHWRRTWRWVIWRQ